MAYLMLAEKKPSNKHLIERTERQLNQMQRQGVRPRDPDMQSFSANDIEPPQGGPGFPPPPEFDQRPEFPRGFPAPRR